MVLNRVIPGIVFIIIAIIFLINTKSFPEQLGRDLGAAFWPKILIMLLIVFSLWLIITGFFKKYREDEVHKKEWKISFSVLKPYIGIVVCVAFVFLFKTLGFIVSVFLFYMFLSHIMYGKLERKFFLVAAIQAVLLVLAIYFLFIKLLGVNLPAGILGF